MRQYFLQMEPARQRLVAVGAALVVALTVAALVVGMHQATSELRIRLDNSRAQLLEVQTLTEALRALSSNTAGRIDLTSTVTNSLAAAGLQPSRLQQNGADELQLRLDGLGFAAAVQWLSVVEQTPGLVVVRLSMREATLTVTLRRI